MVFLLYMLLLLALAAGVSVIVVRATLQSSGLLPGDTGRAAMLERRLQRLEETVDTLAADMQRVDEGQRFLTQVMSERQRLASGDAEAPARRLQRLRAGDDEPESAEPGPRMPPVDGPRDDQPVDGGGASRRGDHR